MAKKMAKNGREAAARWAVAVLYLLGTSSVLALAGIWLLRVEYVPFPEAMLPMKLHELAFGWLAAGAFPMGAATWGVHRCFGFSGHRHPQRDTLLLAIPAVLCGVCLAAEAAALFFMMVQGAFLAASGG